MRVGIVGSRRYAHLGDVHRLVSIIARNHPEAKIVSGGARGVDHAAEQAALAHGLGVISFRVIELAFDEFVLEEWSFGGNAQAYVRRMVEQPSFHSRPDALLYRSTLVVDSSDRLVVFWDGWSGGTDFTLGYARDQQAELRPDLKVTTYDTVKRLPA